MRSDLSRAALCALLLSAPSACVTRPGSSPARPAPAPTAESGPSAEEQRYLLRADSLRSRILATAAWADLGEDPCNPGALRIYPDTSAAARAHHDSTVSALESVIIARGIDEPLDTKSGQALLSTVIRWEAAGTRPRWDVLSGGDDRRAVAAGLGGAYRDPASGQCRPYTATDSLVVVIPPVPGFALAGRDGVRTVLYTGDEGLARARELFRAQAGRADSAEFAFTRLRAVVLWRDYAVVAVIRWSERRAALAPATAAGGASYIFHRVGDEWRLLVVARNWG